MNQFVSNFKDIFEDKDIEIYGYKLNEDFVMLKELEITLKDLKYDAEIAAYVLNPTNKYNLEEIIEEYLEININDFIERKVLN